MPGLDGTGPVGRGVRPHVGSIRGAGYGRGLGWGPGRGVCRWWYGSPGPYYGSARKDPETEKLFLKEQVEFLKAEMAGMEQRINELEQA